MGREAKLREKNGYWYTAANGGQYFGRRDEVSYAEARKAFLAFLSAKQAEKSEPLTVASLCRLFVAWLKTHRSERTLEERRRHMEFFCNFTVGGVRLGTLSATDITSDDLERMVAMLKEGTSDRPAVDPYTADKYATSVKACFNWGRKNPSPVSHLPSEFYPFASVEKYKRPTDVISVTKLPTPAEIDALFRFADADLGKYLVGGKWRKREPKNYRTGDSNPYRGFSELLKVYHATGARTSELANSSVGDLHPSSYQIILGEHKRSKTLKVAAARQITLNDEALAIVSRWCDGKRPDQPIFTDPKGRRWTRNRLDLRFKRVRERAGVRSSITIYSFRHLWISESIEAGMDVATVARMAGTSIAMIEKVYGHLRVDHLRKAQAELDAKRAKRSHNPTAA